MYLQKYLKGINPHEAHLHVIKSNQSEQKPYSTWKTILVLSLVVLLTPSSVSANNDIPADLTELGLEDIDRIGVIRGPGDARGEINVRLSGNKEGNYELIISDNGVVFPEHLDFKKTKTLGLQLINKLAQQLGGAVNLKIENGTVFEIIFPNSNRKTNGGKVCQMQEC